MPRAREIRAPCIREAREETLPIYDHLTDFQALAPHPNIEQNPEPLELDSLRLPCRGGEGAQVSTDSPSIRGSSMKPSTAFLLLLAGLALPTVSSASAAESEWDQERVAALARDLIEPIEALSADLESRRSVPGREAAHAAVTDVVERLRVRARDLAQRLANGAGRDETVALFREVEALQSQAAKQAQEKNYPAPFDMHVHTDRIQATTIQLARYYGGSSDSRDGSHR
jgi:hypothetical protein